MSQWSRYGCLLGVLLVIAITSCGDENGDDAGGTGVPTSDLASFEGAWVISRTSASPQFLTCGETGDPCRQQLERVIDTYFQLPVVDSTCVRIDSLRHLVLVHPFAAEASVTGSAFEENATVECDHPVVIDSDTLLTSIVVTLFLSDQSTTMFADFRVTAQDTGGDDCESCTALFAVNGVRRVSGECGP